VSWGSVENAVSYQLQEAVDPLFSNTIVVYQGSDVSWTVSSPGRIPNPYYYRVKAIIESGESPWSNAQPVTIYPFFIGLHLRWDGMGYIRGSEYKDIGTHDTRDYDLLSPGNIIRGNIHAWNDPNPYGWPDDNYFNYYSVTTGEFLSSTIPEDPSWKWNYSVILPYRYQFSNGQTIYIDNQAFIVSGPISGYTGFGAPVQYWELVNRDQYLYWDGGSDWTQYIHPGEAVLRYDAGNTRILIYSNIRRYYFYQGNLTSDTVQYIDQLTAANSFPGSLSIFGASSIPIPDANKDDWGEIDNSMLQELRK
jgi:hypothetical protein